MYKILALKLNSLFIAYILAISFAIAPPVPPNPPPQQTWDQTSIKYQPVTPDPIKPQILVKVIVSYYNADPNQTDTGPCITADGTNICHTTENIMAANWLPLQTKVEMDGKIYRVADRMNKRYGQPYVDILVGNRAQAIKLGRKNRVIKILN